MSYRWFVYPEPSTYRGDVILRDGTAAKATLDMPANAGSKTIHLIG